ncbi:MAG TPA: discoidin domain-containing protein, partial [Oceanipulchritudo sp.]|nr:discoidin domain-containing protein [Oceanipulchritudo sp.]
ETSPGVSVELSGTTAAPDTPFELSYSVALDAPAPATGWFILEGTQGELTHEQAFTFRVLPEQQLAEIRLMSELEEFPLILEPREQVHLSIRQYDTDGKVMVTPVPFEWITTGGAWVDANGLLTAGFLQGGPFEAKATSGNVELVVDFHVELDWVREQPVFASASLNGNTLPENAVDSDPKTAWVSGDSNDEWLIIDLGELVELSSIEILWHISLWPKAYTVEISSDGNTWTGVQNTGLTSGGEVILGGMEKVGRWLRIKGGAEAGDFTRIGILNVVVQATSMQDILGAPLTNDPGWRYSQQIFGWIYDLTPGQGPHWVYALEKGWQYILGPGLFLRSDSVWGYSQIDQDWWLFSASRPGEWYLMSRGWEFIIQ